MTDLRPSGAPSHARLAPVAPRSVRVARTARRPSPRSTGPAPGADSTGTVRAAGVTSPSPAPGARRARHRALDALADARPAVPPPVPRCGGRTRPARRAGRLGPAGAAGLGRPGVPHPRSDDRGLLALRAADHVQPPGQAGRRRVHAHGAARLPRHRDLRHRPGLRDRCPQRAQGGPCLGLEAAASRTRGSAPRPSDLAAWLFATDAFGNRRAQARRLGIMYVIWNRKIWSSTLPRRAGGPTAVPTRTPPTCTCPSRCSGRRARPRSGPGRCRRPCCRPRRAARRPAAAARGSTPGSPARRRPPAGRGPAGVPVAADVPAACSTRQSPTCRLPATGERTTTPFALRAGQRYLLTATGTYRYGGGDLQADAECSRRPGGAAGARHRRGRGSRATATSTCEVAGEAADWIPVTDTGRGCDTTRHAYTRTVLPRADAPLVLRVRRRRRGGQRGAGAPGLRSTGVHGPPSTARVQAR